MPNQKSSLKIRDVMTTDPVMLPETASLQEAARRMKERDIGDVLVTTDGGRVCGVVTDRDIVVRGLAEGRFDAHLRDICSRDLTSISADDTVDRAAKLMREKAIRRLPVIDGDRPVGIVSIGDLAVEGKDRDALAGISAAAPNN